MPILFATVLIDLIGFGMVIPILPFAAPHFGATTLDIALLVVAFSVCGAIVSPLWGRLSDRWGRKRTLLTCLAGGSACYVLLGFASTLWALYAARILAGCFSGNFGVASAMAADLSTPQNRARAMGLMGAAFGLGMVIGPSLGGLLAGPEASLLKPALVAGSLSFTALLCGALFLRESLPADRPRVPGPKERMREVLSRTGNTGLVAQFLVLTAAISTVTYLFPLAAGHYLGWGPRQVGIVFGVQGLCMAALQAGLIGRLVQRFGEFRLLRVALPLMIAGFTIAAFASTAPALVAGFFIAVSGASCCSPVFTSLLSKRTPLPMRGRMLGTSAAAGAWGRVAGPLIAGLVLSHLDYPEAWLVGAIGGTVTLVWLLRAVDLFTSAEAPAPATTS